MQLPIRSIDSILFCLCICFLDSISGSEDEFRLIQDLRNNYDPIERPVRSHSEPIRVNLRILLQQLVDVKNQVITLVLWTQYTWNDYKMHWDPKEYGNITNIQLPNNFLWKPDILLFNSADEHFDASFPVNFVVSSNGDVLLAPPGIVRVSCELSMTWFPFDEQICFIKYGSWTYTGSKLDLHIDDRGLNEKHKMDLLYYVPNGEFELVATPADRVASVFNNEPYVELYFRLHLKRKTLYYGLNWIVPSILISISNVLGFTMPPECGEKITLQITNLLSVTVFLGMVSDITPPTSESIPIIAVFFSLSMLILGLSIIATLVIINVHFRSPRTHQMGEWTQLVFLEWLPWFLLMSRPGKKFIRRSLHCSSLPSNEDEVGRFVAVKQDRDSDLQADWKFMAMVIDRLSLFLFTVLIVATTSLIFLSTPRMFSGSPAY
uniref:Neurotransmitter-gated ion-channel ligand-binding domain-containing protein n=1 Tax=Angiostrongylus cantonensis TaxID=6313 RepID=A0A158PA63_ANGCA